MQTCVTTTPVKVAIGVIANAKNKPSFIQILHCYVFDYTSLLNRKHNIKLNIFLFVCYNEGRVTRFYKETAAEGTSVAKLEQPEGRESRSKRWRKRFAFQFKW